MTPDYRALAIEAALPEHAGFSAAEKAAAIRAKTVSRRVNVPISTIEGWCRKRGLVTQLQIYLRHAPPEPPALAPQDPGYAAAALAYQQGMAVYTAANELLGTMTSAHIREITMATEEDAAAIRAMLGALVAAGLFTAAQAAEMLAFSVETTPLDRAMGFADLNEQDILAAEKLHG